MGFLRRNLASIITLANLFLGFTAIIIIMFSDVYMRGGMLSSKSFFVRHGYEYLHIGSFLLFMAAIFDFLDGFVARRLKLESAYGKELDSLADLVSFGVLPALIAHNLILQSTQDWKLFIFEVPVLTYLPVVMVLASAIRLAKFNQDDKQEQSFRGLATPANAIFWASIPLVIKYDLFIVQYETYYVTEFISNPVFLSISILLSSVLMLTEIPMFSLKFRNFKWQDNRLRYSFLIVIILLFIIVRFLAIPLSILIYIIVSVIFKEKIKNA